MPSKAELQYKLYQDIRDEIQSSLALQSRVVLGTAIVTGGLYALQFADALSDLTSEGAAILIVGSFPLIVLGAMVVWGTEYARVARASDYLVLLENEINQEVGSPTITWENWIRTGNTPPVASIHYKLQAVGYVITFYALGLLGLFLFAGELLWPPGSYTVTEVAGAVYVLLILLVYLRFGSYFRVLLSPEATYTQANEGDWAEKYRDRPSTQEVFVDWTEEYDETILSADVADDDGDEE